MPNPTTDRAAPEGDADRFADDLRKLLERLPAHERADAHRFVRGLLAAEEGEASPTEIDADTAPGRSLLAIADEIDAAHGRAKRLAFVLSLAAADLTHCDGDRDAIVEMAQAIEEAVDALVPLSDDVMRHLRRERASREAKAA